MNYFDVEYPMWKNQKDFVSQSSSIRYDALVLGDSRAIAAVQPVQISATTHCLCVGGLTPIEGFYLLQKYKQNHKMPRKVIISIAPYHLEEAEVFWPRTVKYSFLEHKEYQEIFNTVVRYHDPLLREEYPQLTYFLYRIRLPSLYMAELMNSGFFLRRWYNQKIYSEIQASRGHAIFGNAEQSAGLNSESRRQKFVLSGTHDFYLNKILEQLTESDVKIIWYTMPFNEASFASTTEEYKKSFNTYLLSLEKKYKNLSIARELYSMPNNHFGDPSHVNGEGRKQVMSEIKLLLE